MDDHTEDSKAEKETTEEVRDEQDSVEEDEYEKQISSLEEKISEFEEIVEKQDNRIEELENENKKLRKSVKKQQNMIEEKKRRYERNQENMERDITEDFVKEIATIRESLKKALDSAEEDCRIKSGIQATVDKIDKLLEDNNVKIVHPAEGNNFNPELHEAIATIESEEYNENKVADVQRSGFLYDGTVLQYAKVIITE